MILRLSSLGDIVLTTPLIRALRERYPESQIDLIIAKEFEALVPLMEGISKVHLFDKKSGLHGLLGFRRELKEKKYDYVLDLHNVLRTRILRRGLAQHLSVINKRTFQRWLLVLYKIDRLKYAPDVIGRYFETASPLGVTDTGAGPKLNISSNHDAMRIAIAPGSRHWNKRWPAENFAIVSKELIARGYHIDLHGSSADKNVAEQIAKKLPDGSYTNFVGMLSLADAAREIGNAGVIITNDSGLMHIAEAVGTRVIAIFGPTVTQFGFKPRAADAVILEVKGLYCRPCTANGLEHCPEKHFRCMMEIASEHVVEILRPMASNMSPKTTV
ncbi:MAG: glycosyltransferase family 9 protein [Candidatus Kapaibacterium sp.]